MAPLIHSIPFEPKCYHVVIILNEIVHLIHANWIKIEQSSKNSSLIKLTKNGPISPNIRYNTDKNELCELTSYFHEWKEQQFDMMNLLLDSSKATLMHIIIMIEITLCVLTSTEDSFLSFSLCIARLFQRPLTFFC